MSNKNGGIHLVSEPEMNARQAKRKLFSEARAAPPLILGTIASSSTATSESSTRYATAIQLRHATSSPALTNPTVVSTAILIIYLERRAFHLPTEITG